MFNNLFFNENMIAHVGGRQRGDDGQDQVPQLPRRGLGSPAPVLQGARVISRVFQCSRFRFSPKVHPSMSVMRERTSSCGVFQLHSVSMLILLVRIADYFHVGSSLLSTRFLHCA